MKTILKTVLSVVFLYTHSHAAMTITGLNGNARCTAAAFGHTDGQTVVPTGAVTPGLPEQVSALKLKSATLTKNGSGVSVNFAGIYALFDSSTTSGGVGPLIDGRAFYNVYKCDEGATSTPAWTQFKGDSSTIQPIQLDAGTDTVTFTDMTLGTPTSKINYIIVGLTNSGYKFNATNQNFDVQTAFGTAQRTIAEAYTDALGKFDGADANTFSTWSNALAVSADYRGSGFALAPATLSAITTTTGQAVSQSFTVTTIADVVTNPTYSFTLNKALPTGLTGVQNGSTYIVSGTPTDVGVTSVTLTAAMTAVGFTSEPTKTVTFNIVVKPANISLTSDLALGVQEIGTSQVYNLVAASGLSAANSVLATREWTLGTQTLQTNGTVNLELTDGKLTIALSEEDPFAEKTFNFDVTVADVCNQGQVCDNLLTTVTKTFSLVTKKSRI